MFRFAFHLPYFWRGVPSLHLRSGVVSLLAYLMVMAAESKAHNVLIIGLAHYKEDVERSPSSFSMNMHYLSVDRDEGCHEDGSVSLPKSLEAAENIIQEKSIDLVMGITDSGSILHSTLVDKYPDKFQGPSLTSVFLGHNKYYTRLYLDPNPIPYSHIDISQPLEKEDLEKVIKKVGLPAIMKPCGGSCAKSIKKITSLEGLSNFVHDVRKNYRLSIVADSTEFLVKHLAGKGIVPMEKTEGFILEQFVDASVNVSVDGYICNKEVIHWTLGDNCYWTSHPETYKMTLIPSELSDQTQQNIWNMYNQVAERLIYYGFDNGGLNQEFLVCKDGSLRLMEVNPRPTMALCKGYCELLENGDYIGTCLQVNRGIRPKDRPFEGKSFCFFNLYCTISGHIEDIINCEVVESLPNVYLKGYKSGDYVRPMGDAGSVVAGGCLVGSSREEVLQKYKSLHDRLVKVHVLGSPCY